MNAWPPRTQRPDLYTHKLGSLMEIAGLRPALENELSLQTDAGKAWLVIKDFDINSRYPAEKPFPHKLARDSVDAVNSSGLVEWLTTGIT